MMHRLANPKFVINVMISSNIIDILSNSPSDKTFCLTLNTDLMMEYVASLYMGA
jgi:hypothetical protein